MVEIAGKYNLESNENLDEYYKAIGVPFIPRKMMCSSRPELTISVDEKGEWTISSSTLLRTVVITFRLGEEYNEHMPGGVTIQSVTTREGDSFVTVSTVPNGTKVIRRYDFNETHCILYLKHEESGVEAKRFYKRA
ncbi:fatty acid-binding protein-like [Onthophagus taurus]|uniref:fatty acid-binding protein-like n=1 Tax=Onthophagus taurus TaxID=166361 RepID=UPI000C20ABDD|nr:fatty acid-binding protein-like [Onthophagus taurus]